MSVLTPIQHDTDGYKLDHISQYVPGTTKVWSNFTPRSDKLARVNPLNKTRKQVFFGLQIDLARMTEEWNNDFFFRPKAIVIAAFARRVKHYVGPDKGDRAIQAMAELHDLGYLPLEVRALPEGTRVPMRIPLFVITNTIPEFFWLVNFCETGRSQNIWPMCNAASLSEQYHLSSKRWGEVTGAPDYWLPIANHCFAARGHRGREDAMLSGMAHSLFSVGTDTLSSLDGVEAYYGADVTTECIGVSVNAFEHATASQRIAFYGSEKESFRLAATELYPRGIFSYVIDTIDAFDFLQNIVRELKDEILARQPDELGLCKTVFRPDSSRKTAKEILLGYNVFELPESDFVNVLFAAAKESPCKDVNIRLRHDFCLGRLPVGFNSVKYKGVYYDAKLVIDNAVYTIVIDTSTSIPPEEIPGVLNILEDIFESTTNDKGYRVINPKVGVIYGESITLEMQEEIYSEMAAAGWCVSNVLFGVGSWAFLKDSSRDSYGMAIKATCSLVNGEIVEMQKTPKTDSGDKHSAKGLVRVDMDENGELVLKDQCTLEEFEGGLFEVVYRDGKLIKPHSFSEIRNRLGFNV